MPSCATNTPSCFRSQPVSGMAEGLKIDGMVGYQLLARFLTTIDYANSTLTLTTPSSAPASAPNAAAIPFYIDGRIPRISIAVDGVTTSDEVDTGSQCLASICSRHHSSQEHRRLTPLAKTQPAVIGFGVGGPAYARLGRVPALQVGPYFIPNGIASFAATRNRQRVLRPLQSEANIRAPSCAPLRRHPRLRASAALACQECRF